jgi:hypothetical protein
MGAENVRRVVVIKNVASNYIEEAIFILRNDTNTNTNTDLAKKNKSIYSKFNNDNNDKDYLIKEAKSIINNYIEECKKNDNFYFNPDISDQALITYSKKFFRSKRYINNIINIILFITFTTLIFFLVKILYW